LNVLVLRTPQAREGYFDTMIVGLTGIILFSVVLLVVLVIVLLIVMVIISEKKTLFSPDMDPAWVDPKEFGAASDELEDVTVTTEDGVQLFGWFYRTFLQKLIAKMREDKENRKAGKKVDTTAEALKDAAPLIGSPTVLFLHGNSGNISHRFPILRNLANGTQFNLFAVDYRGYGKSEGSPSEEGLKKDAEAMLQALVKRDDIDKSRIIVYGQGIGGSLAIHLATQESTRKLFQAMVIENTFTNVHDMAIGLMPGIMSPLAGLLKSKFDSLALLNETTLEIPTLFIASANDEVVPHWQMKKLFSAARRHSTPACKESIKMYRYESKEHHNVPSINEDAFYKNLLEWTCKVLLKGSCTEEEMHEIQEGFDELGVTDDVQEEEPESIDNSDDETEGEEVVPAASAAADEPESKIHKRAKGKKKEESVDA